MKRVSFVLAIALCVMGCSEEHHFEWTDKNAIAPLTFDSETGLDWELSSEYHTVAQELLEQNGISYKSSFPTAGEPTTEAIVINDPQVVADIIKRFDLGLKISEAGAGRYSLVIGYVAVAMSNYRVTQRAKKILGETILRLRVEKTEMGGFSAPCRIYFMALYATELPSGPVSKIYYTIE